MAGTVSPPHLLVPLRLDSTLRSQTPLPGDLALVLSLRTILTPVSQLVRPAGAGASHSRRARLQALRDTAAGAGVAGAAVGLVALLALVASHASRGPATPGHPDSPASQLMADNPAQASARTAAATQDLAVTPPRPRAQALATEADSERTDFALSCGFLGAGSWLDLSWANVGQDDDANTCPTAQSSTHPEQIKSSTHMHFFSYQPLNKQCCDAKHNACSQTEKETTPWWRVAFGREIVVTGVTVTGRSSSAQHA